MTDARPHKTPGPDHPITLERSSVHVVVRSGLGSSSPKPTGPSKCERPPTPRCSTSPSMMSTSTCCAAANTTRGARTRARPPTTTSSTATGRNRPAAVWYYDDPFPAVAEIKGHVAFYADRLTITATPGPIHRTIDKAV